MHSFLQEWLIKPLFLLFLLNKLSLNVVRSSSIQVLPLIHFTIDQNSGIQNPHNLNFLFNHTNNFTYEFCITMTNLESLQQQKVCGLFDVRLSPVSKAYEVCQAFQQSIVAPKELFARCMIPMIHSLRWRLTKYLSSLSQYYQTFPQEGELYGLIYAYEESASFPSLAILNPHEPPPPVPIRRACILGRPHASTLFPALASVVVNEVIVVVDPMLGLDTKHFDADRYVWSDDFLVLSALLGKNLTIATSVSKIKHQCHVIQIEPQVTLRPYQLQFIIHQMIDTIFSEHNLARIIWNSYFLYREKNEAKTDMTLTRSQEYENLFPWHLTNTWCVYSSFNLLIDSNGFTQKGYSFVEESLNYLVKTSIALYSPNKMKDLLSSNTNNHQRLSLGGKDRKKKKMEEEKEGTEVKPVTSKLVEALEKQHQYMKNRLEYLIIITTVNRVLVDNVIALQTAVQSLGYAKVQIAHDLTVSSYETLLTRLNYTDDKIIHLYLGPSDISLFARQYIAFNTEQRWESLVFGKTFYRFHYVLSKAASAWCFYEPLTSYLSDQMKYNNTFTITLYTHIRPTSSFALVAPKIADVLQSKQRPDILFFGSMSERRLGIIEYLQITLFPSTTKAMPYLLRIIAGSWDVLSFDYERDIFVINAAVVLNINNHADSALETHRINYLLSMGKCVISERGSDPSLPLLYGDGVIFVASKEDMVRRIQLLMSSQIERQRCEERGKKRFEVINGNLTMLDVAISKVLYTLSNQTTNKN